MSYQNMRERLLAREGVKEGYDKQAGLSKLGRLIHRARVSTNLRQQELAKLSGVAQGDISRLEIGSGEKGPTFDTLVRLAHAQDMKLVVELVPNGAAAEVGSASLDEVEAESDAPVLRAAF
ncbi:MAG TPA: helix-turn-helix domain-containing protein [Opitutaceae bacterium]|nr:helix-turn-helix domain-containing protein [Opitutaceae bacterium]